MTHKELYDRSLEIILKNQHFLGGYIACPDFPTYRFSWFRDGAYIAYAALRAGAGDSSRAFHLWAAENILRRRENLQEAIRLADLGQKVPQSLHLHTRYTLDGNEGTISWENFQLDGLGTWLWSLGEYSQLCGGVLPSQCIEAAELLVRYLETFWSRPCYDCWEEFREKTHIYTLSSIYGGLKTARKEWGFGGGNAEVEIRRRVLEKGTVEGRLCKYEGTFLVDASLIGASVPSRLFLPEDPLMVKTVERIESDLLRQGGLHRYTEDTYYGGGIWLLLRGWLGLYHLQCGKIQDAREALEWIRLQADEQGNLPEQTDGHLWEPQMKPVWEKKWGYSASPLLWSHAVYIWLYKELEEL